MNDGRPCRLLCVRQICLCPCLRDSTAFPFSFPLVCCCKLQKKREEKKNQTDKEDDFQDQGCSVKNVLFVVALSPSSHLKAARGCLGPAPTD